MCEQRRVLAYRNQLLPISETFIYNQSIRLQRFKAFLLGSKLAPMPRIDVPHDRIYLVNGGGWQGKTREVLFKVAGLVPRDVIDWATKLRPCLLHAHFGPDGVIAIPTARALNIPLIVTFRGRDATLKPEFADNYAHKKYMRRKQTLISAAKIFIAISDFIKDTLIAQGFPTERIIVHYGGIEVGAFIKKAVAESPIVLFVGRLVPKKGCKYLLESFRYVAEKVADAHLIIIGDGPERDRLESFAQQKLRQGSYEFLGAQPHSVVREWMGRAQVLCAPSVTDDSGDSEGLLNVNLEAMASRLPVISTRHGAIPEAVLEGETGLLCAEADVESLGRNLMTLLENQELCRKMGEAGRKRVERFFNLEIQNTKLENIYEGAIRQYRRGDARRG